MLHMYNVGENSKRNAALKILNYVDFVASCAYPFSFTL